MVLKNEKRSQIFYNLSVNKVSCKEYLFTHITLFTHIQWLNETKSVTLNDYVNGRIIKLNLSII